MSREAQVSSQHQLPDPPLAKNSAVKSLRGLTPLSNQRAFGLLTIIFCVWKLLLLCLAAFCPGPGYDTSALVVINPSFRRHQDLSNLSRSHRLTLNLFRWDSFYFVQASRRGYLYEQDWAFSRTYSQVLKITRHYFPTTSGPQFHSDIVAGILVATVCHYVSVFVLYRLLTIVLETRQRRSVALVASVLHILTPASLFYLAPYAESMFACLNLLGMLQYALSRTLARNNNPTVQEDLYKLGSGLTFAVATLMRSNGLLNGLIFIFDVVQYFPLVVKGQLSFHDIRRVLITCIAGILLGTAFVGPQYLAYTEYCSNGITRRPWCERHVPNIYSWVQSHYWNVGLFRYWTIPNIPLFIMAGPMVWLLLVSSVTVLRSGAQRKMSQLNVPQSGPRWTLPELALPQLTLVLAAITSFHVQIVNRIASAYPAWYATIASWIVEQAKPNRTNARIRYGEWIIRGIIIYALVQGSLFAGFLPPA